METIADNQNMKISDSTYEWLSEKNYTEIAAYLSTKDKVISRQSFSMWMQRRTIKDKYVKKIEKFVGRKITHQNNIPILLSARISARDKSRVGLYSANGGRFVSWIELSALKHSGSMVYNLISGQKVDIEIRLR